MTFFVDAVIKNIHNWSLLKVLVLAELPESSICHAAASSNEGSKKWAS